MVRILRVVLEGRLHRLFKRAMHAQLQQLPGDCHQDAHVLMRAVLNVRWGDVKVLPQSALQQA